MPIRCGLLALACIKVDSRLAVEKVVFAAVAASVMDVAIEYFRNRRWILPDGAFLTGMIVAFVLGLQESWIVILNVVAVAILSKHVLRTRWSNIFNPAAFALVVAAIAFKTAQDWWGALPDLGVIGCVAIVVSGVFIADRINKLPMILTFLATYFGLLTIASFSHPGTVAETFRTPDLQAALFFAFFMLDDPPTSPVRHEDQVVFGLIVAASSYFVLLQFGGVYFLPAGLLVGNAWESARRLVVASERRHDRWITPLMRFTQSPAMSISSAMKLHQGRLRAASGIAAALVAVALVATAVSMSVREPVGSSAAGAGQGAASSASPQNAFPFMDQFNADLSGTYSQSNSNSKSGLTVDAATSGDVNLKLHLELVTAGQPGASSSTIVTNKLQLLDPASNSVVCDGKLTAFNRQTAQGACDGQGPYQGVHMTLEPMLSADSETALSGSLSGSMQRTQ